MTSPLPRLSAALLAASLAPPVLAQTTTMIVMDGSGSMWGQIDGRTKLEIAREVVADVLADMPADRVLGLMAYGHRERGNCADIELMVPPSAGSGAAILDAVNAMRFQGKTPLSEAVRQAAEALRSAEEPATVVLVTDGIETCEADPCALAAELEASGVDFTAHVIGFGLTRDEGAEVACIAGNTGGRYIEASDAGELAGALEQAVGGAAMPAPAPPPEPEPEEQTRHFPGDPWMPGFAIGTTGYAFGPDLPEPAAFDFPAEGTAEACRAICEADGDCGSWRYEPKGSFFVDHARCFAFRPGTEFLPNVYPVADGFVSGMKPDVVGLISPYVAIGAEAAASVSLTGPVPPGEEFTVLWSGPAGAEDWVGIVPPGTPDPSGDLSWFYVAETIEPGDRPEGAGSLIAPAEPGLYELRYVFGRSTDRRVIFTMPLPVGVEAPASDTPPSTLLPVRISAPAGHEADPISWSATPLTPFADTPEAVAMPEAVTGLWVAELSPGRWRIEGIAASGLYFAAEIDVTDAAGQAFEIPIGFESEGMGEDAPPPARAGTSFTDAVTGLTVSLPDGWSITEAFFAETAAGVASEQPTGTFVGPEDRMLVLNPLQWLDSNGTCYDSALGPLCVFGAEDAGTDAALAIILPSLSLAAAPAFGGAPFKPQGDDPMSTLVPGWSAE